MQLFLSNSPNGNPDKTLDFVPVSSRFQTASVGGTITVSDVLTTTINGIAIAYTVVGADLTLPILAEHVAAAINATTLSDPVTSLPLNQVVFASSSGNNITIATFNPNGVSSGFSLTYSTTAGATETYTAGGGTPVASIWSGYIDVPQDGFYNVSVTTDAAAVTLEIGGVEVFMAQNGNVWSNQNRISLTAGVLAPIVLTATSIRNSLSVSWSSSPGIGSQIIPGQYLYSATLVNRLQAAYVRFLKATSIATALSLTADEIAYLATSTNFRVNTDGRDKLVAGTNNIFTPASMNNIKTGIKLIIDTGSAQETVNVVNTTPTTFSAATTQPHDGTTTPFPIVSTTFPNVGQGWLNFLGARDTPDTTISAIGANLRGVLTALLAYARIKQALSPNDRRLRLLATLQNPAAVLPNGKLALISLTGWDQTSLNALMTRFFGNADLGNLGSVETLRRVYDAYAFVQTCRISAAALIAVTTNAPSATTIAALQSALRALYAESDWLTVVRPINDTMRIRQRDALVAYILQQLGDNYEQSLITIPTAAPANGGGTTLNFTSTANIKSGMQVEGANILTYTTVMAVGTNTVTIGPGLLGDLPTGSNITFDPGTAPAINTADKLFEYFLLDVETQPPVETSRIRLALSSVQLFIERMLRNLEPQVSAERYRRIAVGVDEALSRVASESRGLPMAGELAVSGTARRPVADIPGDDERAAAERHHRRCRRQGLSRLSERAWRSVAKLEPCGIYYLPGHGRRRRECRIVVARTAGAHRKYYFRDDAKRQLDALDRGQDRL